jgi:hypothetical protein
VVCQVRGDADMRIIAFVTDVSLRLFRGLHRA